VSVPFFYEESLRENLHHLANDLMVDLVLKKM
jgi:hypothetical protein